jgi:5-methylcytosine-specific restriction endonuclease McrA
MCNHEITHELPKGPHIGLYCSTCGKFLKWQPQNNDKRKSSHKDLVNKYSGGYCECCLRSKDSLPIPQTLEAHHVKPYQHEGDSTRENIWILCTQCHKLIEHLRTYLGHYGGQQTF